MGSQAFAGGFGVAIVFVEVPGDDRQFGKSEGELQGALAAGGARLEEAWGMEFADGAGDEEHLAGADAFVDALEVPDPGGESVFDFRRSGEGVDDRHGRRGAVHAAAASLRAKSSTGSL